jgi:integrase
MNDGLKLKLEILRQYRSQSDFAAAVPMGEPRLSRIVRGRTLPTSAEIHRFQCLLSINPRVFTRNGNPITSIREAWGAACQRAGIEDFHFHDLRHTAINNWRLQGHDYFRIMAATGHKTLYVFKRYNTVSKEELKSLVGENPRG